MSRPTIYLAGSIRDHHDEDVQWRESAITRFSPYATVLNPLGGKKYTPGEGWTLADEQLTGQQVVAQDLWCIRRASIVVGNLLSLADNYPSIGTLMELGFATAHHCLIFIMVPKAYTGHGTPGVFKLHPFLEYNSSRQFSSVTDCLHHVETILPILGGTDAHYGGKL